MLIAFSANEFEGAFIHAHWLIFCNKHNTCLDNTVYGASFTYMFQYGVDYSRNSIFGNEKLYELVFFMDH